MMRLKACLHIFHATSMFPVQLSGNYDSNYKMLRSFAYRLIEQGTLMWHGIYAGMLSIASCSNEDSLLILLQARYCSKEHLEFELNKHLEYVAEISAALKLQSQLGRT
jgi:hypothetical protein